MRLRVSLPCRTSHTQIGSLKHLNTTPVQERSKYSQCGLGPGSRSGQEPRWGGGAKGEQNRRQWAGESGPMLVLLMSRDWFMTLSPTLTIACVSVDRGH